MPFWTLECRRASPPIVSIHDAKCGQSPSDTLGGKNKQDNGVEMRRKKKNQLSCKIYVSSFTLSQDSFLIITGNDSGIYFLPRGSSELG